MREIFKSTIVIVLSAYLALSFVLTSCGTDTSKDDRDNSAPQVISTFPLDNSFDVPLDNSIIITFSEPIDNGTITEATLRLSRDGRYVPGITSLTGATVTLDPAEPFSLLSTYTVTSTTGIKDTAGNALAADYFWSFTTRDGSWGPANAIDNGIGNAWYPGVAINQNGIVTAAWSQTDGGFRNIWANRYTPVNGWETAQLIETYDSDADTPQVGVDSNGNAIVVWGQMSEGIPSIWANRYVSGSGWGTAQLIETSSAMSFNPRMAMDNSGSTIAVWIQNSGGQNTIWTNRYEVASGWGSAQALESSGQPDFVTVAIDGTGNAMAVWNAGFVIWACPYTLGNGWGTPQWINIQGGNTGPPQIALDSNGNAIVAWHESDGTRHHIWSNRYHVGTGWGLAQLVETNSTSDAYYPQVGIDLNGNAIVGWYQDDGPQWSTWANIYYADGTGWGTPQQLSANGAISSMPQIAMDLTGNAIVVWFQADGSRTNMWANRYGRHFGWGTAQLIESIDGNIATIGNPGLAVHKRGNVVAVWAQNDGNYNRVWAAWFE